MSENGEIRGASNDPPSDLANLTRELDPEEKDSYIDLTPEYLATLAKQFVLNPEILAKLGKKLSRYFEQASTDIESLPKSIERRVKALERVQFEIFKIESEFYAEVHKLESKYAEKYKPLFAKRSDIVNAVIEPTDEEVNWEDEDECCKEGGDCCDHEALAGESDNPDCLSSKFDEKTKGIPSFWYTTLLNIPLFEDLIMLHDEEVMKHLKDISLTYNDEKTYGEKTRIPRFVFFEIHFKFAENKYFGNEELIKRYYLNTEPSSYYPPYEIYKSSECQINWKEGMNLTSAEDVAKMTGTEVDEKTHKSFFNIFVSHDMNADSHKDLTEEEKAVLQQKQLTDFNVGHAIRSSVISRAILHFTGRLGF